MPRRSGRTSTANSVHLPTPEANILLPPPSCLDQNLAVLRTQWKWAAFCQFTTTFSSLLNMPDITATDIESDLVFGSRKTIPRIMQRLLYTLSYDRKISLENWQTALRKQYLKRDPLSNPLGSEPSRERGTTESRGETPEDDVEVHQDDLENEQEENPSNDSEVKLQPGESATTSEVSRAATQEAEDSVQSNGTQVSIDWFDLPLLTKLDSLHLLTEWQFQNATRLRTLMRSDDDLATWRHEPIGYDSKKNAYWLIGGDRLWIQRVPPKPVKTLKRKRPKENQTSLEPEKAKSPKRQRTKVAVSKADEMLSRSGRGRAAKLQAKIKLDVQARELAELNRQAQNKQTSRSLRGSAKQSPRPLGTRVSARLRGSQTNEWQLIPDEWLRDSRDAKSKTGNRNSRDMKQARNDQEDSVSELTELSDESDNPDTSDEPTVPKEQIILTKDEDRHSTREPEKTPLDGFIEWEAICVTLEDWEHITERFEKATHYLEKALYKYLTTEIVPGITSTLREIEKKKRLEDALVRRKRSSRIALKESEREEARLAAQRRAEEAERMGRARRLEARRQREEEERLRREQAREQRRKEREAREMRRQADSEQHEDQLSDNGTDAEPNGTILPAETTQFLLKSHKNGRLQDLGQPSKAVKTIDWELDCEICYKRGVNLDDNMPMMSCGKCSKWQHITCHDLADERAGRAKRNWDVVEFICQKCRSRMFADTGTPSSPFRDPRHLHRPLQNANLHPPLHSSTPYQSYMTQGYGVTPPSAISTLYQAAKGSYSHYTQPYGSTRTSGLSDRYSTASQPYIPAYHYNQPPAISFSHYQPQEGGFNPSNKAHPTYQTHPVEPYSQHAHTPQHTPYSDLRSSASQRHTVTPPTQTVWSIATPPNSGHTMPYQSMVHTNMVPRQDLQQPNLKPGPSSPNDFRYQMHPKTQFQYHPTT